MESIEKDVLKRIDKMRDEIIEFHRKLISIPSENPPAKYKAIIEYLKQKMEQFGIEVKSKRNNLIGAIGKENDRTLIFNAHFDTVECFKGWTKKPFGGELIDGKIFGRGASDDKSCVTAETFAAKALIDAKIPLKGKLILTAVGDEELGGLRGTQFLLENNVISGDACIVGDASADYPIGTIGGALFISFLIEGKQAHGFMNPDLPPPNRNEYSGKSAIHEMVSIMNFLLKMQEEFNQQVTKYPIPPECPSRVSSINLATIEGGTKVSTVADRCLLHCSIQTIPEHDVNEIKQRIMEFIDELKTQDPELNITVQTPIMYNSHSMDPDSQLALIVKNATKSVYNEEREFKLFTCTTDAHWFIEKGIETILIGTFRKDNVIHSADEFVYMDDLINCTKMFAITALKYLR